MGRGVAGSLGYNVAGLGTTRRLFSNQHVPQSDIPWRGSIIGGD